MKMNNKILGLSILFLLAITLVFLAFIKYNQKDELSFIDYTSKSDAYIEDLADRIEARNVPLNRSSEALKNALDVIDNMYSQGLIQTSENTFYYPPENCEKGSCFSIRELYLFNLQF